MQRIGVISDTHGLLRNDALMALQGAQLILHAGDIGAPEILDRLASIAPVYAVRGNNDVDTWAAGLPASIDLSIEDVRICVLHDVKDFNWHKRIGQVDILISGHSHRPGIEEREGILLLNPGSAGPRRFKLPCSVAWLQIEGDRFKAQLSELDIVASKATRSDQN